MDLAPTILHLSNCPVPNDMEGRVLHESLKGTAKQAQRPVHYIESILSRVQDQVLSADEQKMIEERIRSLGYM